MSALNGVSVARSPAPSSASGPSTALVRELRARVSDRLAAWVRGEQARTGESPAKDTEAMFAQHLLVEELTQMRGEAMAAGRAPLDEATENEVRREVHAALYGFGALQRLLDDESVENILVNGCDRVFVVRAGGAKEQVGAVAASDEELVEMVRRQAAAAGRTERRFDRGSPRLSLRLAGGARLFAVMDVSVRPSVTIRRNVHPDMTPARLESLGTVDSVLREFLGGLVRARANVVVSGGTNTGKTTMLRALVSCIGPDERLVTVEDNAELDLDADPVAHPDVVSLEQRDANIEGQGAITMAELVRDTLRMSPGRIIVGEVRGDEVVPMLAALSHGNEGSLSTVHADSSASTWDKLALYAAMAPERLSPETTAQLVANSLNFVVHLVMLGSGVRVVSSVREVTGHLGATVSSNEVFAPGPDGRARSASPLSSPWRERLAAVGFDAGWLDHRDGFWS